MALDQLKEHLSELDNHVQAYVEDSMEYIELKGFKYSMVLITYIIKVLILSIFISLAFLMLSFFAANYLSDQMGYGIYGYLILGVFYVLAGVVFYLLRNKLNRPLLRIFSTYYFNKK